MNRYYDESFGHFVRQSFCFGIQSMIKFPFHTLYFEDNYAHTFVIKVIEI